MGLFRLEHLPNEILLNIFDYLPTVDRWFSFYNLNIRLNILLEHYIEEIDLSNCRRSRFIFAYETILNRICHPFFLKLLLKRLDQPIDSLFIKLKTYHLDNLLQSLTLTNANDQTINSVIQHLNNLLNLRSLTIIYDSLASIGNSFEKIMNTNIISLRYLKIDSVGGYAQRCYTIYSATTYSTILNIKKLSLGVSISLEAFRTLLGWLPQIVSIDVVLTGRKENTYVHEANIRQSSSHLKKLSIRMNHKLDDVIRFTSIAKLLQELPQLRTFWYTAFICDNSYGQEYHDGQVWEQLIRKYLPNLIDFRLNIGLERSYSKYSPSAVIQSFSSPFYIEEKKWWFVADDPKNNANTIELYSLPPPDHSKIIFRPNASWASNSINPTFETVRTIGLQSGSYHIDDTIDDHRYFPNVTTIEPSHDSNFSYSDNIVSILSNYINLANVKTFIIDELALIEALSAMPTLITLEFQHSRHNMKYFKKISSPIFQLKNLILSSSIHWNHYFDRYELTMLTQLFPNLEYLHIAIKDLQDLIIVINKLPHLISINIFYEDPTVDNNYVEKYAVNYKFKWSRENNKVLIWLY